MQIMELHKKQYSNEIMDYIGKNIQMQIMELHMKNGIHM